MELLGASIDFWIVSGGFSVLMGGAYISASIWDYLKDDDWEDVDEEGEPVRTGPPTSAYGFEEWEDDHDGD